MTFLRTIPAVLSLALLATHYVRAGQPVVVAACLAAILLAWSARPWAVWATRLALVAGAGIWSGTLVAVVSRRQAAGAPWGRVAVILGSVAALSLFVAAVLPGRRGAGPSGAGAQDGSGAPGDGGGPASPATR